MEAIFNPLHSKFVVAESEYGVGIQLVCKYGQKVFDAYGPTPDEWGYIDSSLMVSARNMTLSHWMSLFHIGTARMETAAGRVWFENLTVKKFEHLSEVERDMFHWLHEKYRETLVPAKQAKTPLPTLKVTRQYIKGLYYHS